MGIKSVEMVRKIRDFNYEVIKEMTTQEYLAYIQAKSAAFHNKCNQANQKLKSKKTNPEAHKQSA
jgi:hypothetical protein